jgi:hypothetical protein
MPREVTIGTTTITPTKKPISVNNENDDKGGSDDVPNCRAGTACRIKFEALIDSVDLTVTAALALQTAQDGEADSVVTATLFDGSEVELTGAAVDVSISGDGVQVAAFDCVGTLVVA